MAVWPITLPQRPLREPLATAGQAVLIRSPMDSGPAKVRRRTTAGVKPVGLSYVMDHTQFMAFEAWFENDIAHGAFGFTAPNPFNPGTTSTLRMTGGAGGPAYDVTPGPRGKWIISFGAEIMPS